MIGGIDDDQIDVTNQDGFLVTANHVGGDSDKIGSLKCNLSAGAAPDGSASFSAGYSVGSTWIHGNDIYYCTGDGIWQKIYPQSSSSPSKHYGQAFQNYQPDTGGWSTISFDSGDDYEISNGCIIGPNYIEVDKDATYRIHIHCERGQATSAYAMALGYMVNSQSIPPGKNNIQQEFNNLGDRGNLSGEWLVELEDGDRVYFRAYTRYTLMYNLLFSVVEV